MTGDGAFRPEGNLAGRVNEFFRLLRSKHSVRRCVLGLQGSGWAVLAWDTLGKAPVTYQLTDQQGNIPRL